MHEAASEHDRRCLRRSALLTGRTLITTGRANSTVSGARTEAVMFIAMRSRLPDER